MFNSREAKLPKVTPGNEIFEKKTLILSKVQHTTLIYESEHYRAFWT